MGILTHLFVASAEDARRYLDRLSTKAPLSPELYERAVHEGLTPLEFGTLWAILQQREWDVAEHQLEHMTHGEEGEIWLEAFPQAYTALLAELQDGQLSDLADRWSKTEELEGETVELIPILKDLQRLSKLALAKKQSVYLFGSL